MQFNRVAGAIGAMAGRLTQMKDQGGGEIRELEIKYNVTEKAHGPVRPLVCEIKISSLE